MFSGLLDARRAESRYLDIEERVPGLTYSGEACGACIARLDLAGIGTPPRSSRSNLLKPLLIALDGRYDSGLDGKSEESGDVTTGGAGDAVERVWMLPEDE